MGLLNKNRREIRKSGLFDEKYYLLHNPDVRIADVDPLKHYLTIGWKEGRSPSAQFNGDIYLQNNPDVKSSGINPLVHYVLHGREEGRATLAETPTIRLKETPTKGATSTKILTWYNFRHAMKIIKAYGLKTFFVKAKNKLRAQGSIDSFGIDKPIRIKSNVPLTSLDFLGDKELPIVPKSVSVVIPVKNAGDEFGLLLKNYVTQKGFEKIEIVIVDSGSTDRTLQIARDFGAIVVEISPEAFTHAYARNIGGEAATGDYLFFTVQDAMPPGQAFLFELYSTLIENQVSAVSCAETPREDADLFFKQICWNHYNFLGVNNGDRITMLPEKVDHISLRQNGQLADLANFIPKEIFEKYRFHLNYAEDLDLGIRLIKDGHKLAFLGSTRIIHSHNRPSWYFLKRGYVDNRFLTDVFPDFEIPRIVVNDFIPDIAFGYAFLGRFLKKLNTLTTDAVPNKFDAVLKELMETLPKSEYPGELPVLDENYLDATSKKFIENLIKSEGLHKARRKYDGFLIDAFSGYLNITSNYLKNTFETIDEKLLLDIKNCICKSFAMVVGAHLSYCYHNRNGQESLDMDSLNKILMEGV
jgi:glycosyltransferase involved in cell wall biosynthesis